MQSCPLQPGFLRNKPRNATVRATMNCRCAVIDGDAFRALAAQGTTLRKQLLLEAQTYCS